MDEKENQASVDLLPKAVELLERIKISLFLAKGKDGIINSQGKDLDQYRNGFVITSFKPLAISIIDFRESCRKDLANLDKYALDHAKIKKNCAYLGDDLADLLLNNGLEEGEGTYLYNGHDLAKPLKFGKDDTAEEEKEPLKKPAEEPTEAETQPEAAEIEAPNSEEAPIEQKKEETLEEKEVRLAEEERERKEALAKRLVALAEEIESWLVDSKPLEEAYLRLLLSNREKDADNKYIYVYPCLKKIVSLKKKVEEESALIGDDDKEAKAKYREILNLVIDDSEEALHLLGGNIVSTDDKFNSSEHRLLKAVATEDPELDRQIAEKVTDAYSLDGKLIYPAKVNVFTFKKQ